MLADDELGAEFVDDGFDFLLFFLDADALGFEFLLAFGGAGFAMAYSGVPLEMVFMHGGIAILVYTVLESAFRRRLTILLLRSTLVLAGVSAIILLYEFTTPIIFGAIVALAVLTLFDNVREIRRA